MREATELRMLVDWTELIAIVRMQIESAVQRRQRTVYNH